MAAFSPKKRLIKQSPYVIYALFDRKVEFTANRRHFKCQKNCAVPLCFMSTILYFLRESVFMEQNKKKPGTKKHQRFKIKSIKNAEIHGQDNFVF